MRYKVIADGLCNQWHTTSEVTNETRKSTQSQNIYVTKIRQSRDITKDKSDFTQLAMNQILKWHGYHKLCSFT